MKGQGDHTAYNVIMQCTSYKHLDKFR